MRRQRAYDLWSCLDDGGIFDASGTHFYVSVQHNVSGRGVVLDITGWRYDERIH